MRYLLDTCVVSELKKPLPDAHVAGIVSSLALRQTYLSVITIGELKKGIALLPLSKKRTHLTTWLQGLEQRFAESTLGIDSETSHIWGEITAKSQRTGFRLAVRDGLIAASAIRHGLTVMTRNVKDFEPTGVIVRNPWDE